MKIIGFGHRKRVGKDTAGKFLLTELRIRNNQLKIQRIGFADKVKEIAYRLFSWAGLQPGHYYDENPIFRDIPLVIGLTPRAIWIRVGNGLVSLFEMQDLWLQIMLHTLDPKTDVVIITDVRRQSEVDHILKQGGLVYKVHCPWAPVESDGSDDLLENYTGWTGHLHNSVKNDTTEFYKQVSNIIKEHF